MVEVYGLTEDTSDNVSGKKRGAGEEDGGQRKGRRMKQLKLK